MFSQLLKRTCSKMCMELDKQELALVYNLFLMNLKKIRKKSLNNAFFVYKNSSSQCAVIKDICFVRIALC